MQRYRLVNRQFTAFQLTRENIKEVYDYFSETIPVDITLGSKYAMTIYTTPFYTQVPLGYFVARDDEGVIIVRSPEEFNRYFKLI